MTDGDVLRPEQAVEHLALRHLDVAAAAGALALAEGERDRRHGVHAHQRVGEAAIHQRAVVRVPGELGDDGLLEADAEADAIMSAMKDEGHA